MDELDKTILSIIQTDLPVRERPFDDVAERVGADPDEVMSRIARLRRTGLIRRIGAVFDSRRLGYVSTLVAARIPSERLDEVAGLVGELPGVTHSYQREHDYNLWFTLTMRSDQELQSTIQGLRERSGIAEFHSLPAVAVYKTRVAFFLDETAPAPAVHRPVAELPRVDLDQGQKQLVRLLQEDLPVVSEPFAELADQLGWPVERTVSQAADWLAQGVIRRFGVMLNHRELGIAGNGMTVFSVEPDRIDAIGRHLAGFPEVTHCYHRPSLPDFDYNLFAMIHGRTTDEVKAFVCRIAAELDLQHYDILFSVHEYKKISMKYFLDE